jgi:hypothetical protein
MSKTFRTQDRGTIGPAEHVASGKDNVLFLLAQNNRNVTY